MAHTIKFGNPETEKLGRNIRSSAEQGLPMVEKNIHADDRGVAIVGLGPSIQEPDVQAELRELAERGFHIFGLKEAVSWLIDELGIQPHYGGGNMDPRPREVPRTPIRPGVTYICATSCHPDMIAHIKRADRAMLYHSACGFTERQIDPGMVYDISPTQMAVMPSTREQPYELLTNDNFPFCPVMIGEVPEINIYKRLFGVGDTMCGGFTCGNRVVALANYMGFPEVVCFGLDFGWREDTGEQNFYAGFVKDQPPEATFMNDGGAVDGRAWRSKPDLVASAVELSRMIKQGKVRIVGDSLANSLAEKDDEFLERVCVIQ